MTPNKSSAADLKITILPEPPVTLITGSSKGTGRFLVDHYTRKGNLVVGCSGSPMEETIPGYEHFRADVADEDAVKEIIRAVGEIRTTIT